MLIDTHCHLDAAKFGENQTDLLRAANAAGVSHFVIPSVARANFAAVRRLCEQYPVCHPAYGIHPMYVEQARETDLDALRETVLREHPLAIGEIGLDRFIEPRDDARQEF